MSLSEAVSVLCVRRLPSTLNSWCRALKKNLPLLENAGRSLFYKLSAVFWSFKLSKLVRTWVQLSTGNQSMGRHEGSEPNSHLIWHCSYFIASVLRMSEIVVKTQKILHFVTMNHPILVSELLFSGFCPLSCFAGIPLSVFAISVIGMTWFYNNGGSHSKHFLVGCPASAVKPVDEWIEGKVGKQERLAQITSGFVCPQQVSHHNWRVLQEKRKHWDAQNCTRFDLHSVFCVFSKLIWFSAKEMKSYCAVASKRHCPNQNSWDPQSQTKWLRLQGVHHGAVPLQFRRWVLVMTHPKHQEHVDKNV